MRRRHDLRASGTARQHGPITEEKFLLSAASFSTLTEEHSFPRETRLYQIGTSKDVLVQGVRNARLKKGVPTDGTNRPELSKITVETDGRTPFPNRIRRSNLEKQADRIALIGRLESFRTLPGRGSLSASLLRRCKSIRVPRVVLKVVRVFKVTRSTESPDLPDNLDDAESMVCTLDFVTPWDFSERNSPRHTFLLEDSSEQGVMCQFQTLCKQIAACMTFKRSE